MASQLTAITASQLTAGWWESGGCAGLSPVVPLLGLTGRGPFCGGQLWGRSPPRTLTQPQLRLSRHDCSLLPDSSSARTVVPGTRGRAACARGRGRALWRLLSHRPVSAPCGKCLNPDKEPLSVVGGTGKHVFCAWEMCLGSCLSMCRAPWEPCLFPRSLPAQGVLSPLPRVRKVALAGAAA